MYIITDVNIACLSVNSNYYGHGIEDSKMILLENISEHCYNYYKIRLNLNMSDILSEDRCMINDDFYLHRNTTEEDIIEIFLYKKSVKKGLIFNTCEFVVSSIFQLKLDTDSNCSVKTLEYVRII